MGAAGADDTWRIDSLVPRFAVLALAALAVAAVGVVVVRLVGPGRALSPPGSRPLRHVLRDHPAVRRRLDREELSGLLLTIALAVLVAAGVGFGAVMEMVTSERGLYRLDASAAEWGAEHATPATTEVLEAVTQLGSTKVVAAVAAVVALVAWARRREVGVAAFLAVVVIGQMALSNGIKLAVGRDRPAVMPLVHATGLSFPSGHATAAAAVATALAFVLGRRRGRLARTVLALAAVAVIAVVAATRVLLGVHWLTDVVAGVLLGLGWFTVSAIAFGGRLLRFGSEVSRGP